MFDKLFEELSNTNLYHVSTKNLGDKVILKPRLPDPEQTVGEEDETIPRVCLSSTIEGCLSAITPPEDEHVEKNTFYVYKLVSKPRLHFPTEDQVPDVQRTGEVWALTPAELKLVQKIRFPYDALGYVDMDYSKYEIVKRYE